MLNKCLDDKFTTVSLLLSLQANDGTSCGIEDDEEEEELALNRLQPRAPTVVRRAGGAPGTATGPPGGASAGTQMDSLSSPGPRSKRE